MSSTTFCVFITCVGFYVFINYLLKIKSEMQARFTREFWPLVIFLFKAIRHFSVIRTVSNTKRWFYKKPILEKFKVIANPISTEYLKTIIHLIPIFIYKFL